jgi:hypothetical protein
MSNVIRLIEKRHPQDVKVQYEKVSFTWLWKHVPLEYWLLFITYLVLASLLGFSLCYFFVVL